MPRQRSSGRAGPVHAPSRPTAPAPAYHQQQRPAATMAAPPPQAAAPPPTQAAAPSQGPGLFGQMASTAAGVAVGSSIGHAIGGLFSGGSSAPAEAPAAAPVQQQAYNTNYNDQSRTDNCAGAAKDFTKCMDEQGGNMQICNWYLEQLKACQAAAKPY